MRVPSSTCVNACVRTARERSEYVGRAPDTEARHPIKMCIRHHEAIHTHQASSSKRELSGDPPFSYGRVPIVPRITSHTRVTLQSQGMCVAARQLLLVRVRGALWALRARMPARPIRRGDITGRGSGVLNGVGNYS